MAFLTSEITQGNPVIVCGYVGKGASTFWTAPDGTKINGIYGEHARVAIGFSGPKENPSGIFLLDPIYGQLYWNTKNFNRNWAPFGNSGVVIR